MLCAPEYGLNGEMRTGMRTLKAKRASALKSHERRERAHARRLAEREAQAWEEIEWKPERPEERREVKERAPKTRSFEVLPRKCCLGSVERMYTCACTCAGEVESARGQGGICDLGCVGEMQSVCVDIYLYMRIRARVHA